MRSTFDLDSTVTILQQNFSAFCSSRQTLNLTFDGRTSGRESRGRIFFNGIGTKAAAEADAVTAASSAQHV